MSKILVDKQVILDRIAELEKPVAHYDGIYVSDAAIAQKELLEEILQQSEKYNKKVIVSSYTQKEKEKIIHENITSDEYWTEHKNVDGSVLKVKVKVL